MGKSPKNGGILIYPVKEAEGTWLIKSFLSLNGHHGWDLVGLDTRELQDGDTTICRDLYPLVNVRTIIGKSPISMAIFNSYVSLPEGIAKKARIPTM